MILFPLKHCYNPLCINQTYLIHCAYQSNSQQPDSDENQHAGHMLFALGLTLRLDIYLPNYANCSVCFDIYQSIRDSSKRIKEGINLSSLRIPSLRHCQYINTPMDYTTIFTAEKLVNLLKEG